MENPAEGSISTEARGHVFLMGIDRARKMNAFDLPMLRSLMAAFTEYEKNDEYRCAVIFAHGDHFTAGIDLASVKAEHFVPPPGMLDPMGIYGPERTKPLVIAIHGRCLTIGIELALASDICVAAENARFGQIEVKRGIYAISGATMRMVPMMGWGNAMRYLLTGDEFDANEAYRVGLVQEVTPVGQELDRAIAIAETIAAQAPLAVRATLASARQAVLEGQIAAVKSLIPKFKELAQERRREGGTCAPSSSAGPPASLAVRRRRMVRPQHAAAGFDRGQQAVGDPARLHGRHEIADGLVPDASRNRGVGLMVGDDLHVALAQRHEQQDPAWLRTAARVSRGEFAMRQMAGVGALDVVAAPA